jgi:hypothetical protein
MRFRKLRIAFSSICAIACVPLCVLWVRSYWQVEMIGVPLTSKYYFGAASQPGCIGFTIHPLGQLSRSQIKRFQSYPTESWLETVRQERLPNISRVWGTFDFQRYSYIAPDWFVLIVIATFATLPWLRWRFSLRTLLIAVTAIAVVLGLVVWSIRRSAPSRRGSYEAHRIQGRYLAFASIAFSRSSVHHPTEVSMAWLECVNKNYVLRNLAVVVLVC